MNETVVGEVVELDIGNGITVLGEWFAATAPMGCVLLLHDRDDDLDSMRPFARQMQKLYLATLLVDLPGHGLSGGLWEDDAQRAVGRAVAWCAATGLSLAVLAAGDIVRFVLAQAGPPVGAVVVIGPKLSPDDLDEDSPWRTVPMLAIADPSDPDGQRSQQLLGKWLRAWFLRLHAHYLDSDRRRLPEWLPQLTSASAAFIAEQVARSCEPASPRDRGTVA